MSTLYDIFVLDANEQQQPLNAFKGKVLLIVNVASRCGFTYQYQQLEALYRKFKDSGFVVLAFPCDQFAHQEPGSNKEIQEFAKSCFSVSFPIFAKIEVNGPHQSELYAFLEKNMPKKRIWKSIPWNFTKFLVDKNGRVLHRYWPIVPQCVVEWQIKKLLKS